ncbi:hypothetical protein ACE1CB_03795 [Aerosakkonema sp. BLCC-F2]
MSNVEGVTPNHLLQQIYGTQLLDEDVDLKLSDEELELIAMDMPQCESSNTKCLASLDSDVFVGDTQIISFSSIKPYVEKDNHQELINYLKGEFSKAGISISDQAVGVLSNNLRATAPIITKREHQGFIMNLSNGNLCYLDTPGCTPAWVLQ